MTPAESDFIELEYDRCLATGAWEVAPPDELTHISRAHLVKKKTPPGQKQKYRLVIDLRPTNAACRSRTCRYETLKALQKMAARGSWAISFDVQDAYHMISIRKDHRRYMTFALPPPPSDPDGPPRYLRCAALPFGSSQHT